ncbi:MAG: restriction endonuclease subunit S [Lentisphaeria bacterium]|nr:restriction endonuclease subunit S [Lentisphaeria bacterium]
MSEVTIPNGWQRCLIGEVADVIGGGTPKAGDPRNFAPPSEGLAWLTPADLSGYEGKYISHGARDLSQTGYDSSAAKLMPEGTLLFSSRAPIGYVAVASNEICTNQGFKNFVFPEAVDSSYAYYYLKSIRQLAESMGTGTTFREISGAKAKQIPFLLPPLAEQQEIARQLDDLLAQVETLKTRLDGIPAILKRFRQSTLAAAVSGKLTEEWRKENRLEKQDKSLILESRRHKWEKDQLEKLMAAGKAPKNETWKKRYKVPPQIEEDDCFEIPKSWSWSNLGEVSWSVKDGPHFSPPYTESGIPFISGGNVRPEGIGFSDTKYISPELHAELSKRCRPNVGDILYTKGGTTGIAYFNTEPRDFNVWVHVAVLRLVDGVDGRFIQHALNSKHCYDLAQRYTHGVGNQDLGLTRMVKITIPLPPLNEQTEIVRRVEELFAFADQIEQRVRDAQTRVDKLTQSILAKAFRGDLTESWRAANPDLITGQNSAEALLTRIKEEREMLVPKKRPRNKKEKAK